MVIRKHVLDRHVRDQAVHVEDRNVAGDAPADLHGREVEPAGGHLLHGDTLQPQEILGQAAADVDHQADGEDPDQTVAQHAGQGDLLELHGVLFTLAKAIRERKEKGCQVGCLIAIFG